MSPGAPAPRQLPASIWPASCSGKSQGLKAEWHGWEATENIIVEMMAGLGSKE